jgi:hypothetical protein
MLPRLPRCNLFRVLSIRSSSSRSQWQRQWHTALTQEGRAPVRFRIIANHSCLVPSVPTESSKAFFMEFSKAFSTGSSKTVSVESSLKLRRDQHICARHQAHTIVFMWPVFLHVAMEYEQLLCFMQLEDDIV